MPLDSARDKKELARVLTKSDKLVFVSWTSIFPDSSLEVHPGLAFFQNLMTDFNER